MGSRRICGRWAASCMSPELSKAQKSLTGEAVHWAVHVGARGHPRCSRRGFVDLIIIQQDVISLNGM